MQHLFVFGSLRPGYANEHVMKKIGGECVLPQFVGIGLQKVGGM